MNDQIFDDSLQWISPSTTITLKTGATITPINTNLNTTTNTSNINYPNPNNNENGSSVQMQMESGQDSVQQQIQQQPPPQRIIMKSNEPVLLQKDVHSNQNNIQTTNLNLSNSEQIMQSAYQNRVQKPPQLLTINRSINNNNSNSNSSSGTSSSSKINNININNDDNEEEEDEDDDSDEENDKSDNEEEEEDEEESKDEPSNNYPLPRMPTLGKELCVDLKRIKLPISPSSVYKILTVPKNNGLGFKTKYDPLPISHFANLVQNHSFNLNLNSPPAIMPVKVEINHEHHLDADNDNDNDLALGLDFLQEEENVELMDIDLADNIFYNNNEHDSFNENLYGHHSLSEHHHNNTTTTIATTTITANSSSSVDFDEICRKIGRKLLTSGKVYCPLCYEVFDHQIQLASHEILGCNNNSKDVDSVSGLMGLDPGQRSYSPPSAINTHNNHVSNTSLASSSSSPDGSFMIPLTKYGNTTISILPSQLKPARNQSRPSLPAKHLHGHMATKATSKPPPAKQQKILPKPITTISVMNPHSNQGQGQLSKLKINLNHAKALLTGPGPGHVSVSGSNSGLSPTMKQVRGPRGPYRKKEGKKSLIEQRKNRVVLGGFYFCPFFPCQQRYSNKEVFHGHLRDCHLPPFAPGQAIICTLCPVTSEGAPAFAKIAEWGSHISGLHISSKKPAYDPHLKYRRVRRKTPKNQDPLGLPSSGSNVNVNPNWATTALAVLNVPHHQHQLQQHQLRQSLQIQQQQQQQQQRRQQQQQQDQTPCIVSVKSEFGGNLKGGGKSSKKKKRKDLKDQIPRRLFSCPFKPCPNNFFGSSKLFDSHLKSFHASKSKPHICALCPDGVEYHTLFAWVMHIRQQHVQEVGTSSFHLHLNNHNINNDPHVKPSSISISTTTTNPTNASTIGKTSSSSLSSSLVPHRSAPPALIPLPRRSIVRNNSETSPLPQFNQNQPGQSSFNFFPNL